MGLYFMPVVVLIAILELAQGNADYTHEKRGLVARCQKRTLAQKVICGELVLVKDQENNLAIRVCHFTATGNEKTEAGS